MLPWLLLIFRDKWNSARVIFKKCPWKLIYRVYGYYTTQWYLMCRQFWTLLKLTFQSNFKCKTCLARYDHLYLVFDEFSKTSHVMSFPTWSKKTDLTRAWRFRLTNKKSPLKSHFLVVSVVKSVCCVMNTAVLPHLSDDSLCVPCPCLCCLRVRWAFAVDTTWCQKWDFEPTLTYRSMPLRNGFSPSELMQCGKLRTSLPVIPQSLFRNGQISAL